MLARFKTLVTRFLRQAIASERGTIAIVTAVAGTALIGALSLGAETSYWWAQTRNMQQAADSAALAAATAGVPNYVAEARAVAGQYGFVNGTNNISVNAINDAACPAGGNTCYQVTISSVVRLYLAPTVGYNGNATLNGAPAINLTASAVATQTSQPREYCLLALDTSGDAIQTNGAPKADFSGCSIMSNAAAHCNGHNLLADFGDAHLTSSNCGVVPESNMPTVVDPYSHLASNIPPNTCASYPQVPAKKNDPPLPASNLWSGTKSLSGNVQVCGDLQLTADTVISAPSGAVLVIENGQLDTNGFTLSTANGSKVTIVFSGTAGAYTHAPTGGGTLDITAPASGVWSGVAIYQDPQIATGVDVSAAGNSPTWDITGLVYLPNSNVTFSGAVNKSSNGQSCFVLVVKTVTVNGTGSIFAHGGCAAAGLSMPSGQPSGRPQLVL